MAGSTATKRANAQLDKSYKRATGEIDDRKGAKVKPGDIVTAVFLLIAAKSFNDQCEAACCKSDTCVGYYIDAATSLCRPCLSCSDREVAITECQYSPAWDEDVNADRTCQDCG